VREVIRPALAAGDIVLCDRFYDSTTAYQGYGRQLDLHMVRAIIDSAVGKTQPDLTLLLTVPYDVSQERLLQRQSTLPFMRDRIEEADRAFFERVAHGYQAVAAAEPERVRPIDATGTIQNIEAAVWREASLLLPARPSKG
jgi:dTMP kinase